jgi:hypothetical protein
VTAEPVEDFIPPRRNVPAAVSARIKSKSSRIGGGAKPGNPRIETRRHEARAIVHLERSSP